MTGLREKLIEAGADAMTNLPFDTLELRDWGKDSVADPARVLSEAALDAILDTLSENADEWDEAALGLATSEAPPDSIVASFIAALRDTELEGER